MTPSFFKGINAAAVSDPFLTTNLPAIKAFYSAAGHSATRTWHEGLWTQLAPEANYLPTLALPGQHIIVANAQNSVPRCTLPAISQFLPWFGNLPAGCTCEFFNEINHQGDPLADGSVYLIVGPNTLEQIKELMAACVPSATAKGITMLPPSILNDIRWLPRLYSAGIYNFSPYVTFHAYADTDVEVLALIDSANKYATSIGLTLLVTEWGCRPKNATPAQWAAMQKNVIIALQQGAISNLSFPLYVLGNDLLDKAAPFNPDGSINQPFHDAMIQPVQQRLVEKMVLVAPDSPVDFSGRAGHVVSDLTLMGAANAGGGSIIKFDANSSNCALTNVTITSADGQGFAGNIRGSGIQLQNVSIGSLADGPHYDGCTNLAIIGGGQTGADAGRCHFFLDVDGLGWTGDPTRWFGPASKQSPIRFSYPGVRNGSISSVCVTQFNSSNPIACWAIHSAYNISFGSCTALDGEFSLDSADNSKLDAVTMCRFTNLNISGSKLHIGAVAAQCQFIQGSIKNSTGECISLECLPGSGNVIDGMTLYTDSGHGIHAYSPSDVIVKNCKLIATNPRAVFADGVWTKANDGGGNTINGKPIP